jgi:RAB protein geranylgeranyltransferase component A
MPLHFAPQPQVRLIPVLVLVRITTFGTIADVTQEALTRLRSYLRSAGRYGASPFLVGHYGGLGEIAQGFCRVSAVNGGVYILDRKTVEITPPSAPENKFVAHLDNLPEPLTADVLISARDQLTASLHPFPEKATHVSLLARCILVIDKPIPFPPSLSTEDELSGDDVGSAPIASEVEDGGGEGSSPTTQAKTPIEAPPVDTSIIIFPPRSVNGGSSTKAAQAFTTGAGTLSAPQGKCKEFLYRVRCN